jgi:hypothetical protein
MMAVRFYWCTTDQHPVLFSMWVLRFTCKATLFRVEPRGFEPLTSAVQKLIVVC